MNRIKSFSDLNTRTKAKSKQTLLRFFNSKLGTKNIKEIKKKLGINNDADFAYELLRRSYNRFHHEKEQSHFKELKKKKKEENKRIDMKY